MCGSNESTCKAVRAHNYYPLPIIVYRSVGLWH
eukprot:COSAG06_NODE_40958_length_396_cov_1.575758_2_plen_32_part_01